MKVCAVIPTFRNAGTVVDIVSRTLTFLNDVIVVIDGSPDDTKSRLESSGLPVTVVECPVNKGKGAALLKGFVVAREKGFDYAVTLDSDGQHFPEDIPAFLDAVGKAPGSLLVGSRNLSAEGMPSGNSFANRFSNFWFRLYTWTALPDTQTGFRAYPLSSLPSASFVTSRYEAELELLVFSAWKGLRLQALPIRVAYPEDRVTSFRPLADFLRIFLLNTALLFAAILYGWPRMALNRLAGR